MNLASPRNNSTNQGEANATISRASQPLNSSFHIGLCWHLVSSCYRIGRQYLHKALLDYRGSSPEDSLLFNSLLTSLTVLSHFQHFPHLVNSPLTLSKILSLYQQQSHLAKNPAIFSIVLLPYHQCSHIDRLAAPKSHLSSRSKKRDFPQQTRRRGTWTNR